LQITFPFIGPDPYGMDVGKIYKPIVASRIL